MSFLPREGTIAEDKEVVILQPAHGGMFGYFKATGSYCEFWQQHDRDLLNKNGVQAKGPKAEKMFELLELFGTEKIVGLVSGYTNNYDEYVREIIAPIHQAFDKKLGLFNPSFCNSTKGNTEVQRVLRNLSRIHTNREVIGYELRTCTNWDRPPKGLRFTHKENTKWGAPPLPNNGYVGPEETNTEHIYVSTNYPNAKAVAKLLHSKKGKALLLNCCLHFLDLKDLQEQIQLWLQIKNTDDRKQMRAFEQKLCERQKQQLIQRAREKVSNAIRAQTITQ